MSQSPLSGGSVQARLWQIFAAFEDDPGPAFCTNGAALSFAALFDHALALRSTLRQRAGAATRAPVLIYGHKDLRYPVAYWACLLSGRALIPVEPETPAPRVAQIIKSCGATALLVAEPGLVPLAQEFAAPDLRVIEVADPLVPLPAQAVSERTMAQSAEGDIAYLMFSSGTLGQPKGIGVTYANLLDFIAWLDDLYPQEQPIPAVSGVIRHCFDVSLFELWTSWTRRCPLVALNHAEFANSTGYLNRLAQLKAGLWVSTPSIARLFLSNPRFSAAHLPELRNFLFCGEVLSKKIVAALNDRFPGCRITNTYGPTECTVAVTSVDITAAHLAAERDLPIGAPRRGTWLEATPLADGRPGGELVIRGASVGAGYIGLPEKTRAAFPEPALYHSGDRGVCGADGLWYFAGRLDREVKIQGVRINLNDVETHLRNLPGVEDVVIEPQMLRGVPHALAAYVLGPRQEGELKQLAEGLAAELPPYLVPRYWYAAFPARLNQNSKFDRATLGDAAKQARLRHIHMPSSAIQTAEEEPA